MSLLARDPHKSLTFGGEGDTGTPKGLHWGCNRKCVEFAYTFFSTPSVTKTNAYMTKPLDLPLKPTFLLVLELV